MTYLAQRFILAASLCFSATAASASHADAQQRQLAMPPIRHVFIIVLENRGFDTTFNAHPRAPYLADTLRLAGAFVRQYHGTAHYSLGNYLAMSAGVASTPKTQIDCPRLKDFVEAGIAPDCQPIGDGCV
jgi:phospholipase C